MSHELRTPLNAIIGYSEILAEDAEDCGRKDELADLQKIRSAGKHLLALINDVLDLSKIEAGKAEVHLETFEVSPMLQEDVPSQPRRWARLNGSLRRSDTLVSAALWLADSMARPAPDLMARRNGTPAPNGWHGNSPKPLESKLHRPAIVTGSMAKFSPGGFVPWAFVTGQPRPARHGRMDYGTADWLDPAGMP